MLKTKKSKKANKLIKEELGKRLSAFLASFPDDGEDVSSFAGFDKW